MDSTAFLGRLGSNMEDSLLYRLTIESVVYPGKGLARLGGKIVFVPGALPGETILARTARSHKSYIEAELIEVIDASPARIKPLCPFAAACPGCSYQHAADDMEIQIKNAQLAEMLVRQVHLQRGILQPPILAGSRVGYRNRVTLHIRTGAAGLRIGYVSEDNVTVTDIPRCLLAADAINDLLAELRGDSDFMHMAASHRALTLRHTASDGVFHVFGRRGPARPWVKEDSPFGPLNVPRSAFYQVNSAVASALVRSIAGLLRPDDSDVAVDLHSGVGVFAIAAAKTGFRNVLAGDVDREAVKAARANVGEHCPGVVQVANMPATRTLRTAVERYSPWRMTVIADPPRSGLDEALTRGLLDAKPRYFIYVSCAADTLARDLSRLTSVYRVVRAQMFDMFPRTAFFETVICLEAK